MMMACPGGLAKGQERQRLSGAAKSVGVLYIPRQRIILPINKIVVKQLSK
jgi:hypothetical protein